MALAPEGWFLAISTFTAGRHVAVCRNLDCVAAKAVFVKEQRTVAIPYLEDALRNHPLVPTGEVR